MRTDTTSSDGAAILKSSTMTRVISKTNQKPHLFLLVLILLSGIFLASSCANTKKLPYTGVYPNITSSLVKHTDTCIETAHGKLQKNEYGIWELAISGDPLTRGLSAGALTQELIHRQENIFVDVVRELVPSPQKQRFIRGFLRFFNRSLEKHVNEEYRLEIFGMSRFSSNEFDFIAPPYHRMLYFHAAHDIGHALQDLAMVGCTSFAAWGTQTTDGKLLIGRNFDFYVNDDFAAEKIIYFIKPDNGHPHAIISWPGMVGAVSGMNDKGLTVTINAGKSNIPFKATTPISLVAREILQYAQNIQEAVDIAQTKQVFVSESLLIGSAADKKAMLIELSPKKIGVYEVETNQELLVCTNHFQSKPYLNDKKNLRHISDSHSQYRFNKVNELIANKKTTITPHHAAQILRDRSGLNEDKLGLGNEMALNQLMAHHAVIFQPEDRLMWVSANPYQLGEFVAYDLSTVFADTDNHVNHVDSLLIPKDTFLYSKDYQDYRQFRKKSQEITHRNSYISDDDLRAYIALNPNFWKTYVIAADYYYNKRQYKQALHYYQEALVQKASTLSDRRHIEKQIKRSIRRLK